MNHGRSVGALRRHYRALIYRQPDFIDFFRKSHRLMKSANCKLAPALPSSRWKEDLSGCGRLIPGCSAGHKAVSYWLRNLQRRRTTLQEFVNEEPEEHLKLLRCF